MQGTNRIYEEPSRLSQMLVVGLSIAVVLMASWLAVTITLSQTAPTSVEGATDATAAPDGAASLPTTLRQPVHSNSVHFDWPAEFASSAGTPAVAPPTQTATPLAPEVPSARDLGRGPWPPAVPDARDRSLPSHGAGVATEATDAIVDLLTPPVPPRAAAAVPPPRQGQAQRRQKPRVVETEAAQ
jgi:hypothetical protein